MSAVFDSFENFSVGDQLPYLRLLDMQRDHIDMLKRYGIIKKAVAAAESQRPAGAKYPLIPANAILHLCIGREVNGDRPKSSGLHMEGPFFEAGGEYEFGMFIPIVRYPAPDMLQVDEPFNEEEGRLVHDLAEEVANSGLPGLCPTLVRLDPLSYPPNASADTW